MARSQWEATAGTPGARRGMAWKLLHRHGDGQRKLPGRAWADGGLPAGANAALRQGDQPFFERKHMTKIVMRIINRRIAARLGTAAG